MKILLAAVNAKYIHSNLAVYCLKSYAASKGQETEIAEYTINQQTEEVLRDLYERNADVVAFSCYIWNIEFIKTIIKDYKKIRPQCEIWLGGPEVSYRAEEILAELPEVRGVMVGEGEETFAKLVAAYREAEKVCETDERQVEFSKLPWREISGIVVRNHNGEILGTNPAEPLDFSSLPFPYGDGSISVDGNVPMNSFENCIIYYESSRGCPFSCAYCLSSLDKRVRFRDMDLVKQELKFFLDRKVPQVKFIDRTFNINGARTIELLQFIKENDNGITNFHFEAAAELLTKEQIEILNSLRPGLVQLEIGVQSTNMDTLAAVNRKTELSPLKKTVAAIREKNNVHIHLDLIAGLPKEDLESFKNSFNEVYNMKPHQLQLGFLKVLSGAPMEDMAAENGTLYQSKPPYEVLSTKWLSFDDLILLKKVEELVEVYYNSGQFRAVIKKLETEFASPFSLYESLARYYEERGLTGISHNRLARYEILYDFIRELPAGEGRRREIYRDLLMYDLYLRENVKSRPSFAGDLTFCKEQVKQFFIKEAAEPMYLRGYEGYDSRQLAKMAHLEPMGDGSYVLFDYKNRDAMFGNAKAFHLTAEQVERR